VGEMRTGVNTVREIEIQTPNLVTNIQISNSENEQASSQ
jgi:hypothetical protein